LGGWHQEPRRLLESLGFEPLRMEVPRSSHADFGLDPAEALALQVVARRDSFLVFRLTLAGGLEPDTIRRVAAALYRHNPARRALLIFDAPGDLRLTLASWGLGPGPLRLQKLWIDTWAPRPADLDILARLAAPGAVNAAELALAHSRALDRERVTRRFFAQFRRHRARLAAGLVGMPADATQDRLDLALLLLSRLLFLYFIQRKGWLGGDPAFIHNLYEAALDESAPFYRRRLKHLFFGALNRPPEERSRAARQLGELPYLNGGLFERTPLERSHPKADVPDACFAPLFHDLLEKYQFTLREDQPADQDVAVDPEMLGKVFEGLMAGPVRSSTGAFFTPRAPVDLLVDGALAAHLQRATGCDTGVLNSLLAGDSPAIEPALRDRLAMGVRSIRVLDPAAGSGAFLLAVLQRLETLRDALDGEPGDALGRFARRGEIIRRNLHGVDVNAAAVRLCELRLWLALIVDLEVDSLSEVPALPNLDINIRQGDALVDPIDFLIQLADLDGGSLAGRWRRSLERLSRRRERYFRTNGTGKRRAQRALARAERDLAIEFMGELAAQIDSRRADLGAAARGHDLFGRRSGLGRRQKQAAAGLKKRRRELTRLMQRVCEQDELPFFSFPVHFADPESGSPSFDVIVGNPPWVRSHHWSGLSRRRLRQRFRFLREAGWRSGSRMAGAGRGFGAQLDLSALFLERSLELLADDGALGFLLPAKLTRSLSAAALRRQLLTTTRILRLEDWALATSRLFDATTYPLSLLLGKGRPEPEHRVSVCVHDRRAERLDFQLPQRSLPLLEDDHESPWALAPPPVRRALRRMQRSGPMLGASHKHRPRRGIFTGGNAIFVGELGDRDTTSEPVAVRLGESIVPIEPGRLRPTLRGEDLAPWRFDVRRLLVWTHDDDGRPLTTLPANTLRYLSAHRRFLETRVDLRPGAPYWALFRVRALPSNDRVAWRDIAPAPGAVVLPPEVPFLGDRAPIVTLNTVYEIFAASGQDAHLLAGVLNSTVARAYLRAIAERASGGYFRFLGWTVALLPYPRQPDAAAVRAVVEMSRQAHAQRCLPSRDRRRLDAAVAQLYGLTPSDLKALRAFDARLTNVRGSR
jgi:hypothetical protein